MRLLIGIPAFNEANTIGDVLKTIPKKIRGTGKIDILVVDDGSTDKTSQISHTYGAIVLRHLINRGLGGALKTILTYAKNKKYELLVTLDADGQHNPKDIPTIVKFLYGGNVDVVITTRWKKLPPVTFSRFLVNWFANFITYILFGVWTTDSQSGFRGFTKKAIERINIQSDGMEVSSEFFKEIHKNHLRFIEIPIQAIYTKYSRQKGQKLTNSFHVLLQLFVRLLK
ncbi:glycosyltransferase family 2 protein [Candidatus Gottesmanbacteria bacterium]|nr:glycosyltransferase family 2 protein [Candidatus Gottesmanbacteria bacterium]